MRFNDEVSKQLKFYVYRLIDPRNGETFYVGKGTDNRVFQHAADKLEVENEDLSEKLKRIRDIRSAGFGVTHVIHRHGMESKTALEVEAALIDAFPGSTNLAGGHNSGDRGVMHAMEIENLYSAKTAVFKHPMIAIKINRTSGERNIYDAVRYAWKLDLRKAKKVEYVLAVVNGMIIEAFEPVEWLEATPQNFPGTEGWPGRRGFTGRMAPERIRKLYVGKRLPKDYRKKGAANPIQYIDIK